MHVTIHILQYLAHTLLYQVCVDTPMKTLPVLLVWQFLLIFTFQMAFWADSSIQLCFCRGVAFLFALVTPSRQVRLAPGLFSVLEFNQPPPLGSLQFDCLAFKCDIPFLAQSLYANDWFKNRLQSSDSETSYLVQVKGWSGVQSHRLLNWSSVQKFEAVKTSGHCLMDSTGVICYILFGYPLPGVPENITFLKMHIIHHSDLVTYAQRAPGCTRCRDRKNA